MLGKEWHLDLQAGLPHHLQVHLSALHRALVGTKGETKALTFWALSVCVTLGKSFNLFLPQFPQL